MPIASALAAPTIEPETAPLKGPPHILCIDDDPDIHTTIELRFREYDVVVDHSYYGMQGIVDSRGKTPDLIITDIAMPNGDGQFLIETIRLHRATSDVPVIVLTGLRTPGLEFRLRRAGADVYLQKPVPFDELQQTIERFIELRPRQGE